jgi:hypothetical protein
LFFKLHRRVRSPRHPHQCQDGSLGISSKSCRRAHSSSCNCTTSSLSIPLFAAQSILHRTHWPTMSAYCVNGRGDTYPYAIVGTSARIVEMPRGLRRSPALKSCEAVRGRRMESTRRMAVDGYSVWECKGRSRAMECRPGSDLQ